MSRSMAINKPVHVPVKLERFFENPPLVGSERREDYDDFFLAIAAAVTPVDVIQWIHVREFSDISWELKRERRIKAEIIKALARNPSGSGLAMTRADFERSKLEIKEPSMFKKKVPDPEVTDDQSGPQLVNAYMVGHREIDIIDTRIASYLFRRHAVLREIERYSESLARKLERAAPDIIDGECTDAAE